MARLAVLAVLAASAVALQIAPTEHDHDLRLRNTDLAANAAELDPSDLRHTQLRRTDENPLAAGAKLMEQQAAEQKALAILRSDQYLQKHAHTDKVRSLLKDKHIVMVGDSVLHFQYLNLAHYVAHDEPPPFEYTEWKIAGKSHSQRARAVAFRARGKPEAVNTAERVGPLSNGEMWKTLYNVSNEELNTANSKEVCDCWRDHGEATMVENRYLELPKQKAAISFMRWVTDHTPLVGHWKPEDGYPIEAHCIAGDCSETPTWKAVGNTTGDGMLYVLQEHILKMKPTPTHIVMGHSNWGHLNDEKLNKLMALGQKVHATTGTKFIWSVGSKRKYEAQNTPFFKQMHPDIPMASPESDAKLNDHERKMAQKYGWETFSLDHLTSGLEGFMEDDYHYDEKCKTYMNSKFIQQFFQK